MLDEKAVQRLIDKDAIAEVVGLRYARGLDWGDVELLQSCFHPDAVVDYGVFKGNAHEFFATQNSYDPQQPTYDPGLLNQFHYCFPPQIEIDGNTAHSEVYSWAGRRFNRDGKNGQAVAGSRYIDTLERRDTGWKISSRHVFVEFVHIFDSMDTMPGFNFMSGQGPSHPFYRRMSQI